MKFTEKKSNRKSNSQKFKEKKFFLIFDCAFLSPREPFWAKNRKDSLASQKNENFEFVFLGYNLLINADNLTPFLGGVNWS